MTIEIEGVIREHRIDVGNASCSCGKLYMVGISTSMLHAEQAQHVAERLAPLMKPAAADRTLIDAAKAYRDAIDAAHEDEHGKPHCAIQCNGVDESSGLEIGEGSRFHEDLMGTAERTRSALDYVLSATGEVADGQQEAIKSKLAHAFVAPNTTCTGCGHLFSEHEIDSVDEITYSGTSATVEMYITCNECDGLL